MSAPIKALIDPGITSTLLVYEHISNLQCDVPDAAVVAISEK